MLRCPAVCPIAFLLSVKGKYSINNSSGLQHQKIADSALQQSSLYLIQTVCFHHLPYLTNILCPSLYGKSRQSKNKVLCFYISAPAFSLTTPVIKEKLLAQHSVVISLCILHCRIKICYQFSFHYLVPVSLEFLFCLLLQFLIPVFKN